MVLWRRDDCWCAALDNPLALWQVVLSDSLHEALNIVVGERRRWVAGCHLGGVSGDGSFGGVAQANPDQSDLGELWPSTLFSAFAQRPSSEKLSARGSHLNERCTAVVHCA
eukprot:m.375488 g.375488  ORF g.375488 m.375488 type:complete len:111 (-) comp56177_c1_seq3:2-334(-)